MSNLFCIVLDVLILDLKSQKNDLQKGVKEQKLNFQSIRKRKKKIIKKNKSMNSKTFEIIINCPHV